jgi:hypothetical protein
MTTVTKTTVRNGLVARTRSRQWRDRPSKGRVYVPNFEFEPQPTDLCSDLTCGSAWCESARRNGKPEYCEVDHKQWKRWLRNEIKLTKALITPILAQHFDVPEAQVDLRFSRKAGCSCGCSPGFIIDRVGAWNVDTWVRPTCGWVPAHTFITTLVDGLRAAVAVRV